MFSPRGGGGHYGANNSFPRAPCEHVYDGHQFSPQMLLAQHDNVSEGHQFVREGPCGSVSGEHKFSPPGPGAPRGNVSDERQFSSPLLVRALREPCNGNGYQFSPQGLGAPCGKKNVPEAHQFPPPQILESPRDPSDGHQFSPQWLGAPRGNVSDENQFRPPPILAATRDNVSDGHQFSPQWLGAPRGNVSDGHQFRPPPILAAPCDNVSDGHQFSPQVLQQFLIKPDTSPVKPRNTPPKQQTSDDEAVNLSTKYDDRTSTGHGVVNLSTKSPLSGDRFMVGDTVTSTSSKVGGDFSEQSYSSFPTSFQWHTPKMTDASDFRSCMNVPPVCAAKLTDMNMNNTDIVDQVNQGTTKDKSVWKQSAGPIVTSGYVNSPPSSGYNTMVDTFSASSCLQDIAKLRCDQSKLNAGIKGKALTNETAEKLDQSFHKHLHVNGHFVNKSAYDLWLKTYGVDLVYITRILNISFATIRRGEQVLLPYDCVHAACTYDLAPLLWTSIKTLLPAEYDVIKHISPCIRSPRAVLYDHVMIALGRSGWLLIDTMLVPFLRRQDNISLVPFELIKKLRPRYKCNEMGSIACEPIEAVFFNNMLHSYFGNHAVVGSISAKQNLVPLVVLQQYHRSLYNEELPVRAVDLHSFNYQAHCQAPTKAYPDPSQLTNHFSSGTNWSKSLRGHAFPERELLTASHSADRATLSIQERLVPCKSETEWRRSQREKCFPGREPSKTNLSSETAAPAGHEPATIPHKLLSICKDELPPNTLQIMPILPYVGSTQSSEMRINSRANPTKQFVNPDSGIGSPEQLSPSQPSISGTQNQCPNSNKSIDSCHDVSAPSSHSQPLNIEPLAVTPTVTPGPNQSNGWLKIEERYVPYVDIDGTQYVPLPVIDMLFGIRYKFPAMRQCGSPLAVLFNKMLGEIYDSYSAIHFINKIISVNMLREEYRTFCGKELCVTKLEKDEVENVCLDKGEGRLSHYAGGSNLEFITGEDLLSGFRTGATMSPYRLGPLGWLIINDSTTVPYVTRFGFSLVPRGLVKGLTKKKGSGLVRVMCGRKEVQVLNDMMASASCPECIKAQHLLVPVEEVVIEVYKLGGHVLIKPVAKETSDVTDGGHGDMRLKTAKLGKKAEKKHGTLSDTPVPIAPRPQPNSLPSLNQCSFEDMVAWSKPASDESQNRAASRFNLNTDPRNNETDRNDASSMFVPTLNRNQAENALDATSFDASPLQELSNMINPTVSRKGKRFTDALSNSLSKRNRSKSTDHRIHNKSSKAETRIIEPSLSANETLSSKSFIDALIKKLLSDDSDNKDTERSSSSTREVNASTAKKTVSDPGSVQAPVALQLQPHEAKAPCTNLIDTASMSDMIAPFMTSKPTPNKPKAVATHDTSGPLIEILDSDEARSSSTSTGGKDGATSMDSAERWCFNAFNKFLQSKCVFPSSCWNEQSRDQSSEKSVNHQSVPNQVPLKSEGDSSDTTVYSMDSSDLDRARKRVRKGGIKRKRKSTVTDDITNKAKRKRKSKCCLNDSIIQLSDEEQQAVKKFRRRNPHIDLSREIKVSLRDMTRTKKPKLKDASRASSPKHKDRKGAQKPKLKDASPIQTIKIEPKDEKPESISYTGEFATNSSKKKRKMVSPNFFRISLKTSHSDAEMKTNKRPKVTAKRTKNKTNPLGRPRKEKNVQCSFTSRQKSLEPEIDPTTEDHIRPQNDNHDDRADHMQQVIESVACGGKGDTGRSLKVSSAGSGHIQHVINAVAQNTCKRKTKTKPRRTQKNDSIVLISSESDQNPEKYKETLMDELYSKKPMSNENSAALLSDKEDIDSNEMDYQQIRSHISKEQAVEAVTMVTTECQQQNETSIDMAPSTMSERLVSEELAESQSQSPATRTDQVKQALRMATTEKNKHKLTSACMEVPCENNNVDECYDKMQQFRKGIFKKGSTSSGYGANVEHVSKLLKQVIGSIVDKDSGEPMVTIVTSDKNAKPENGMKAYYIDVAASKTHDECTKIYEIAEQSHVAEMAKVPEDESPNLSGSVCDENRENVTESMDAAKWECNVGRKDDAFMIESECTQEKTKHSESTHLSEFECSDNMGKSVRRGEDNRNTVESGDLVKSNCNNDKDAESSSGAHSNYTDEKGTGAELVDVIKPKIEAESADVTKSECDADNKNDAESADVTKSECDAENKKYAESVDVTKSECDAENKKYAESADVTKSECDADNKNDAESADVTESECDADNKKDAESADVTESECDADNKNDAESADVTESKCDADNKKDAESADVTESECDADNKKDAESADVTKSECDAENKNDAESADVTKSECDADNKNDAESADMTRSECDADNKKDAESADVAESECDAENKKAAESADVTKSECDAENKNDAESADVTKSECDADNKKDAESVHMTKSDLAELEFDINAARHSESLDMAKSECYEDARKVAVSTDMDECEYTENKTNCVESIRLENEGYTDSCETECRETEGNCIVLNLAESECQVAEGHFTASVDLAESENKEKERNGVKLLDVVKSTYEDHRKDIDPMDVSTSVNDGEDVGTSENVLSSVSPGTSRATSSSQSPGEETRAEAESVTMDTHNEFDSAEENYAAAKSDMETSDVKNTGDQNV